MFIHVDRPGGPHIHIPFPIVLLFRPASIKEAKELSAACRSARKYFGKLELVRVDSEDGTRVRIVL